MVGVASVVLDRFQHANAAVNSHSNNNNNRVINAVVIAVCAVAGETCLSQKAAEQTRNEQNE